jgi:rhodanese-related sulfurtransferase
LMRRAAKRILKGVMGETTPPAGPATRPPPTRPAAAPAPDMSNIECGAQELKERLDAGEPVTILDVREAHETSGGIIEGALRIPLGQLEGRWEELKNADEVVCYCALGARSLQAAGLLRSKGVDNATSMDGGVLAWQEAGGALVQPE